MSFSSIDDPFVYYDGDIMLLRAAFVELVIRKVLQDNGFEHKEFASEFSPDDPEGYDVLPETFDFLQAVFIFMGYQIDMPDEEEICERLEKSEIIVVKIKLPELDGLTPYKVSKYRKAWLDILKCGKFYGLPCDVVIRTSKDKKSTLLFYFYEDLYYMWAGIADLVFNFCEFRKRIKEVFPQDEDRTNESRLGSEYPMSA